MSEKKGNLVKLKYDFNESLCCEVKSGDNWAQVTAREFRSWNGKKRLQFEDYEGPLYYYGTNEIVGTPSVQGLIFKNGKDPREDKRPKSFTAF